MNRVTLAPTEVLGGECMRAFAAVGRVVLIEIRPDGSPGIELHIPADEFSPSVAEEFQRKVRRKQARASLRLMK